MRPKKYIDCPNCKAKVKQIAAIAICNCETTIPVQGIEKFTNLGRVVVIKAKGIIT